MREFVIMSDVNTDINGEYAAENDIKLFPQYYHFNDGTVYGDGEELTPEQFYGRLAEERAYSMGCNPDRVRGIMEEPVKEGKDIIAVMASSGCSGSYNTVCTEAADLMQEYPGAKIHVVDSLLESIPAGLMVYMAQEMKKAGSNFEEVVETLERRKLHLDAYFIVDDLKYLVRGGRLSSFSGAVGTMLNIKPILHFRDGMIVAYEKCRGKKAAKKKILDDLAAMNLDKNYCSLAHSVNRTEAEEYAGILEKELGMKIFSIEELTLIIGTHTGPGALGVAFMTAD